MTLTKFEVGKPFPLPVMQQEGSIMDLWSSGLIVIIQMPGLTRAEVQAFKKSFKRYGYLESSTPVPVAMWIFDFPAPHGPIDVNFDARSAPADYIEDFLTPEAGKVKNAVTFYLLDGQILRGQKLVGLDPEAVRLFHATIRKQISMDYTMGDYSRYLSGMFEYNSKELLAMSTVFRHAAKK